MTSNSTLRSGKEAWQDICRSIIPLADVRERLVVWRGSQLQHMLLAAASVLHNQRIPNEVCVRILCCGGEGWEGVAVWRLQRLIRTDADIRQAVKAWCGEWTWNGCKVQGDPMRAEAEYGHISEWDTEQVTNMGYLFAWMSKFNEDISAWSVSAVTSMRSMFYRASSFNQDLSAWDVFAVTNMHHMFYEARSFNQDLGRWNVAAVADMNAMFYGARSFNQDLSAWNVAAGTEMRSMFFDAISFNQDLSAWKKSDMTEELWRSFQTHVLSLPFGSIRTSASAP